MATLAAAIRPLPNDFSAATTAPSVFTSAPREARFIRTRVRPGSKAQVSLATPARAISAIASSRFFAGGEGEGGVALVRGIFDQAQHDLRLDAEDAAVAAEQTR